MDPSDLVDIRLHEDPALFREAVNYTSARTGFVARLIEQDYFCSVLLVYLAGVDTGLVFKGGTCLAKVHAEFYRISEDLDFAIPMSADASRRVRSGRVAALKDALGSITRLRPEFQLVRPLTGASDCRQYAAEIRYRSLLTGLDNGMTLEVGLREPLLTSVHAGAARTLLMDPVSGLAQVEPVTVNCLSRLESFTEKFRAALTRREAAIRDFFDIDYGVRRLGIAPEDPELLALIRRKLAVAGNEPIDVSEHRLAALRRQIEPVLKPVLRDRDFAEFDLARAFGTVADLAARLA